MSDESDWENEDILSKLKRHLDDLDINYYAGDLLHDAVDEIETLREQKKTLCLRSASLLQRIEEIGRASDKLLKDGWMEWKKAGKPGDWGPDVKRTD